MVRIQQAETTGQLEELMVEITPDFSERETDALAAAARERGAQLISQEPVEDEEDVSFDVEAIEAESPAANLLEQIEAATTLQELEDAIDQPIEGELSPDELETLRAKARERREALTPAESPTEPAECS